MPRRKITGKVVSDKMDKTITVTKDDIKKHSRYKKYIKRTSKYHAHDENNEAQVGDVVEIVESRPYSKTKKFVLERVIKKDEFEKELEELEEAETPEEVDVIGGEKE